MLIVLLLHACDREIERAHSYVRGQVVLICIFNLAIAMCAEYTTIGTLFSQFVGSVSYPIIITQVGRDE